MIVGLDTASDRWHCVMREGGKVIEFDSFKVKDKNPDVRRIELYRSARTLFGVLAKLPPDVHIFCEEPLALANGKTTRLLSLACGAIWAAHIDFDLTWWWANVAAWKKSVIGRGDVNKDEIRLWSELCADGQAAWDEDHHDANAIAVYGERELARATSLG